LAEDVSDASQLNDVATTLKWQFTPGYAGSQQSLESSAGGRCQRRHRQLQWRLVGHADEGPGPAGSATQPQMWRD